jgi:hypothetical protein
MIKVFEIDIDCGKLSFEFQFLDTKIFVNNINGEY